MIDATPGLAGKSQVTFRYVTTAYHCREHQRPARRFGKHMHDRSRKTP